MAGRGDWPRPDWRTWLRSFRAALPRVISGGWLFILTLAAWLFFLLAARELEANLFAPHPTVPSRPLGSTFLSDAGLPVSDADIGSAYVATLDLEPVQFSGSHVTLIMKLALGSHLMAPLIDLRTRHFILTPSQVTWAQAYRNEPQALSTCGTCPFSWSVNPPHQRDIVTVQLRSLVPYIHQDIRVPLQTLVDGSIVGSLSGMSPAAPFSTTLDLPTVWQPWLYPGDWAGVAVSVRVDAPPNVGIESRTMLNGRRAFFMGCYYPRSHCSLPVDVVTRLNDANTLGDIDVAYVGKNVIATGPLFLPFSGVDSLLFTRNLYTQLFIYLLACAPLLLILALIDFTVRRFRRRATSEEQPALQDLLVGVAAVSITILPLRVVLVPPDVPGLTRVDLILGTEVLAMIAIGIASYAAFVWPWKPAPPAGAPAPAPATPNPPIPPSGSTGRGNDVFP